MIPDCPCREHLDRCLSPCRIRERAKFISDVRRLHCGTSGQRVLLDSSVAPEESGSAYSGKLDFYPKRRRCQFGRDTSGYRCLSFAESVARLDRRRRNQPACPVRRNLDLDRCKKRSRASRGTTNRSRTETKSHFEFQALIYGFTGALRIESGVLKCSAGDRRNWLIQPFNANPTSLASSSPNFRPRAVFFPCSLIFTQVF